MNRAILVALVATVATVWAVAGLSASEGRERSGYVRFSFDLKAVPEAKKVRLWLPYPVSDANQRIDHVKVSGNYASHSIERDPLDGQMGLYAEWDGEQKQRALEMSFRVKAKERAFRDLRDTGAPIPADVLAYTKADRKIPVDGVVKEIADKVSAGRSGILERARAAYEWTIANTHRDPSIKGCGVGIVEQTITRHGGKCADISSVFVAIARASGVPAREVFGLRLGKKPEEDISGGHHCWAEFYLPGTGWVPVDPADVRKAMLVNKLGLAEAKQYIDYYFGAVDEYRIALETGGRDVTLSPAQEAGPINFFMFPYAEFDGLAADGEDPKGFAFSISFKEL